MKIVNSRVFRKGRVLHNAITDFVLINSSAPRTWDGIVVEDGGKWTPMRGMTAVSLVRNYEQWDTGLRSPLSRETVEDIAASVKATMGVDLDWRTKQSLRTTSWAAKPISGMKVFPTMTMIDDTPTALVDSVGPTYGEKTALKTPAPIKEAKTLAKRVSTFTVPTLPEMPYWYESDNDRKMLRDFISLRKAGFTVNLMISGPSGSGKTRGIEIAGKELGIPVHIVNCQAITTPEKWIGQMHADPVSGTMFIPSQHIQWVEATHEDCADSEACIILYDEITRLRPELNNMTYSLFDTQRGLEVPQMGRRVKMHPKNLIISTANIGAAFSGTFGQDRAFRERFSMTMERDFPPQDEEVKILTSATAVPEDKASMMAKVAAASRRLWREQTIDQPISTRTLVTWALLVAGGYDAMTAAEYTVLPLYSDDGGVESDRAKVRLQIEGKAS